MKEQAFCEPSGVNTDGVALAINPKYENIFVSTKSYLTTTYGLGFQKGKYLEQSRCFLLRHEHSILTNW